MGEAKTGAKTLPAYLQKDEVFAVKQRAEELQMSVSKVISSVVKNWSDSGCPPINDLDAALQLVKKAKAEGKSLAEISK